MKFFKNIFVTIRKELQTIITISYIISIGIGMLFNAKKYSEFGINIFDYADVFFYLIAPFADIKILFFTLISLIIPYLIYFSNDVVKRKGNVIIDYGDRIVRKRLDQVQEVDGSEFKQLSLF